MLSNKVLLGLPLQVLHVLAGTHQVVQRFVFRIRHPHRRQFAGPMQPGAEQVFNRGRFSLWGRHEF